MRALAREYKVGTSTIHRLSEHTAQIRNVAETLVTAHQALATLPPAHQYAAVNLAEKLRNISSSLASAAELGAKTSHRLQALANNQVAKVDDADPMASISELRDVGVLTKLANDSAAIALNLLSANKDRVGKLNDEGPPPSSIDPTKLSSSALAEFMAARVSQ